MKNKKAESEMTVFVWLILLVIYFSILIISAHAVALIDSEQSSLSNELNVNLPITPGDYFCNDPRYEINLNDGTLDEMNKRNARLLSCSRSMGMENENTCNSIPGCNWTEITTGWWFWKDTGYTCDGQINSSVWNIDYGIYPYGGYYVEEHEPTIYNQFLGEEGELSQNICIHDNVIQNRSLCSILGCTWSKYTFDSGTSVNPLKLWNTISSLFSNSYDWGITNSSINFIINTFFVLIPGLMLLIILFIIILKAVGASNWL